MRHALRWPLAALLVALLPRAAGADLFVLANEGEVRGEWLNREESPRRTYVIRTEQGAEVTLAKAQVVKVVRESEARLEYQRISPDYPDTPDGQWRLAEWCREKRLTDLRRLHLERVIELDPLNEPARQALGYVFVAGRWTTQDEIMTERGFVRYHGRWLYPQEVELLEEKRKVELAEIEWARKLKRWREWLDGARAAEAQEAIAAIDDPHAVSALAALLDDEEDALHRALYLEALGRIGTWPALDLLIERALGDQDEDVRLAALDQLEPHKHPDITAAFVQALQHPDNVRVNRAAVALGRMADPAAIRPLIGALVTTHKLVRGSGGEGLSTSFDPGAGTFSAGSGRREVERDFQNEAVRDALVKLTDVNFQYEEADWMAWYAEQRKTRSINLRRD